MPGKKCYITLERPAPLAWMSRPRLCHCQANVHSVQNVNIAISEKIVLLLHPRVDVSSSLVVV